MSKLGKSNPHGVLLSPPIGVRGTSHALVSTPHSYFKDGSRVLLKGIE